MKKKIWWGIIAVAIAGSPFLLTFLDEDSSREKEAGSEFVSLQWRDLRSLSLEEAAVVPELLLSLAGKQVEIPGFVVPLEDDLEFVTEFILVPSAMACIHVPPPPPNQIVHVKLSEKQPTLRLMRPQFVRGTFKIQRLESIYGGSLFLIEDAEVETYRRRGF
jgi:hypothetical protein